MSNVKFDTEFYGVMKAQLEGPTPAQPQDAYQVRKSSTVFLEAIAKAFPAVEGIEEQVFSTTSYDGAVANVVRFASQSAIESDTPLPAVLWIHGGGMVSGTVAIYARITAYLAEQLGYPVFAVEQRYAPEYSARESLEDCYAALAWLSKNAKELTVDAAKLSVMGDSAGGLMSASTALDARDSKLSPPVAKQVLIYPTLDDRTPSTDKGPRKDFLMWTERSTVIVWDAYSARGQYEKENVEIPPNAIPARVEDLSGLPLTHIDCGTVDLFLEENLTYVKRLIKAGVDVELHVQPGLPHGWELAGVSTGWFKATLKTRIYFIKRDFYVRSL
ncbi:Alpha/Beta hydrolase protein [Trichoderma compactum]